MYLTKRKAKVQKAVETTKHFAYIFYLDNILPLCKSFRWVLTYSEARMIIMSLDGDFFPIDNINAFSKPSCSHFSARHVVNSVIAIHFILLYDFTYT